MRLSVIFCNKSVEIKKGQVSMFKGSRARAFKELNNLHKEFVAKECIDNTKDLLHGCFESAIDDIVIKDKDQEGIVYELAEMIEDGIIEQIAETEAPCVTIVQEDSNDETSFSFVAISNDNKTIHKIVLHVGTDRIDINIKKGNMSFE